MHNEEQQEIRQQFAFAEDAYTLLKDKQTQLMNSKQQNECHIAQHDFQQIKSYAIYLKNPSCHEQEKPIIKYPKDEPTDFEIKPKPLKTYTCPLIRPNVFGITFKHNIRFDCEGLTYKKYKLTKHLEYYHRMLPEYAIRLTNAVGNGQSSDQTKIFSDDEIILVNNKTFFFIRSKFIYF